MYLSNNILIALVVISQFVTSRFVIKEVGFRKKPGFTVISNPEVLELYSNSSGEYVKANVETFKPVSDHKVF